MNALIPMTHRLFITSLFMAFSMLAAAGPGDVWRSHISAGFRAQEHGHYAEAESQFVAAPKTAEAFEPLDPRVATTLNNLAELYRARGKYAEAEALHKRSLAILEKGLGPERPEVAAGLENYAALLRMMDREPEAQPSDPTSAQEVEQFAVEAVEPVSGLEGPSGWMPLRYRRRPVPVIGWSAIEVEDPDTVPYDADLPPSIAQIKPGGSRGGFSFQSPKPPGPVKYFVTGYVPLGGTSDAADDAEAELIAESLLEACPHLQRHILDQAAVGSTLGPVDTAVKSVPAPSPAQRLPSPTE